MYESEINEFVQGELSFLDLSTKEQQIFKDALLRRINNRRRRRNIDIDINIELESFLHDFENLLEYFKELNYSDEEALEFTKNIVNQATRKNIKKTLDFYRNTNILESELRINKFQMRGSLDLAHARKKYLVEINDKDHQTRHYILHITNDRFEKNHGITQEELLKRYPITEETYAVWNIIATQTDDKIKEYFGMTREELSYIYPTTKEEIAIIHKLATMAEKEVINTYGVCKKYILSRKPLSKDTLIVLKTINKSSTKAVYKYFRKAKAEVVLDKTLTLEKLKKTINR